MLIKAVKVPEMTEPDSISGGAGESGACSLFMQSPPSCMRGEAKTNQG